MGEGKVSRVATEFRVWMLRSAAVAAGAAVALGSQAVAQDAGAAAGQRFLAHLEANQPISGEFQIVTEIDAAQQSQLSPPSPPGGAKLQSVPEPVKQTLNCRWAWAAGREVCEALPGSSNSRYGFLTLPEGTLSGINSRQFNLTKAEMPGAEFYRPALFYFFSGGNHWREFLASARFSVEPQQAKQPDVLGLVARDGKWKTALLVDKATGRLREAAISFNDVPSWGLVVEELAVSKTDGRAFPSKARIEVYGPFSAVGKPFRTARLTANRVDFPTDSEVAKQFQLPIPAKAMVADRVLNAAIDIPAPTDAATIIVKDMPRTPYTPREEPAVLASPDWGRRAMLVGGAAVLPPVIFLLYKFIARRNAVRR